MALFNYSMVLIRSRSSSIHHAASRYTAIPPFPSGFSDRVVEQEDADFIKPKDVTTCPKCGHMRPARTHHCSRCGVCHVRYDHHCAWTAGCIAMHNYTHFWALLFWGTVGTDFGLVATGVGVACIFVRGFSFASTFDTISIILSVCGVLSAAFLGFSTTTLFSFHVRLIRTNQTTLEFHANSDYAMLCRVRGVAPPERTPYDLGSAKKNIEDVFGPMFIAKLLLPLPIVPPRGLFYWERIRQRCVLRAERSPSSSGDPRLDTPLLETERSH